MNGMVAATLNTMFVPFKRKKSRKSTDKLSPGAVQDILGDDNNEDGDSGPAPPCIASPAPLGVIVTEFLVGARPMAAFDAIFKENSEFRAKMESKEALRNVVAAAFEDDPVLASSSGFRAAKSRRVTYVRPLSIPMAPRQCNVIEEHSCLVLEEGGFLVEVKVSTTAPKGDTFFCRIQWLGVVEGSKTRVRICLKVEFIKGVGLLKGIIESGAMSATKKGMQAWADELVKDMPVKRGKGVLAADDITTLVASPCTGGVCVSSVVAMAVGACVLLLLLCIGSGLWDMARSIQRMADALTLAGADRSQQRGSGGDGGGGGGPDVATEAVARLVIMHLRAAAAASGLVRSADL